MRNGFCHSVLSNTYVLLKILGKVLWGVHHKSDCSDCGLILITADRSS
jgi:hypothetical protein